MSEISKRMIMIMDIYRWVVALGGGATGAHFFIQQTFSIKFERAHPTHPQISKTYAMCLFLQCTCQKSGSSKNWIKLHGIEWYECLYYRPVLKTWTESDFDTVPVGT